jgi:hypothetical protein
VRITTACAVAALCATSATTAAVAATPPSQTATDIIELAKKQTGYDGHLCGAPDTGVAIRDRASDSGKELGRMYNGDPLHVYATHNSAPNIPEGWALGYGRPHGGNEVRGYFKLRYVCRP